MFPSGSTHPIRTVLLQKAENGAVPKAEDDILLELHLKNVATCLVSFMIQRLNWGDILQQAEKLRKKTE